MDRLIKKLKEIVGQENILTAKEESSFLRSGAVSTVIAFLLY